MKRSDFRKLVSHHYGTSADFATTMVTRDKNGNVVTRRVKENIALIGGAIRGAYMVTSHNTKLVNDPKSDEILMYSNQPTHGMAENWVLVGRDRYLERMARKAGYIA